MHKTPALGTLLLITLAACGGGVTYGGGSASSPHTKPASSGGSAVRVGSTSLGKVLVDGQGRTLYMLTADSPGHSTCNAQCLGYWPPDTVSGSVPQAGAGVTAKLGSTPLMTGGRTLTADGWPLYTYVQDAKPGDVTGQGVATFGGVWYVVSPSGHPVTSAGSPTGSSGGAPGGY